MADHWRFAPAALSHIFWRRKKQFQLENDTYEDWVLFAVTEGSFRYRIEQAEGTARFGDIVFCPPGSAFHREALEPVSFHFYRFRWRLDAPTAQGPADEAEPRPVGAIAVLDRGRLSSTYYYLQQLAGIGEEQRMSAIGPLFGDIWQLICIQDKLRRDAVADARNPRDEDMLEAERWLREHAFEPLFVKDFAAEKGISAVQLTRRFQAAWGQTPIDYLTSLRIGRAKDLLLETRLTLDEIAERCGYENGFYLSRVFAKQTKLSPSQFRKMNRL